MTKTWKFLSPLNPYTQVTQDLQEVDNSPDSLGIEQEKKDNKYWDNNYA